MHDILFWKAKVNLKPKEFRHSKLDQKCQHETVTRQLADMSTDNGGNKGFCSRDGFRKILRAVQLACLSCAMKQREDTPFPECSRQGPSIPSF